MGQHVMTERGLFLQTGYPDDLVAKRELHNMMQFLVKICTNETT